jgi:hypothetical protein
LKAVREKTNNIYRQTLQNNSRFLNRNLKSKKGMQWGISNNERKQIQA